ncbi:DNA-directed RNA polymerase III subunit RPC4 [Gossypium australe]|uniref:DNA-directed RNA polymerase III subunit RPC4 n=1 Tax=Gossypium australe TaxID=47621 RepID=A0A5B6WZ01_9ROSI|nr:DNA-directed RNA polymerase III subunit RPC4 [Gossypium australe]
MEPKKEQTNAPRKMRFAPKAPPRKAPKLEVKTEVVEDIDAVQARDLLQRLNQTSARTKPKVEKKVSSSQVAFGFGGGGASIKTFVIELNFDRFLIVDVSVGGIHGPGLRVEKEYKEPWDYYSYYPLTLPMRRPYSGNPGMSCVICPCLDEEEFAAQNVAYDENSIEPAVGLGLMEENLEPTMLFLQLPPTLPIIKAGHEGASSSGSSRTVRSAKKTCGLTELPAGLMGKMLVYKSGAVKLKLGDTIYDVNPGLSCVFAQDVVAVDTAKKQCCVVGEVIKHAVVTPDMDSVLNSLGEL